MVLVELPIHALRTYKWLAARPKGVTRRPAAPPHSPDGWQQPGRHLRERHSLCLPGYFCGRMVKRKPRNARSKPTHKGEACRVRISPNGWLLDTQERHFVLHQRSRKVTKRSPVVINIRGGRRRAPHGSSLANLLP